MPISLTNIVLFSAHGFFVFILAMFALFVNNIKALIIIALIQFIVLLLNFFHGDCPISIIEDKQGGPAVMDFIYENIPKHNKYNKSMRPTLTLELIYIGLFLFLIKIMVILFLRTFKKQLPFILKTI